LSSDCEGRANREADRTPMQRNTLFYCDYRENGHEGWRCRTDSVGDVKRIVGLRIDTRRNTDQFCAREYFSP
jgi:hypothetical protein